MTTDLKTSLLVNKQVPEFVRDEYPKFVAFLEAYYQFLEQKQGTEINDLTTAAKNLRTIKDVDDSIDEFEQSFYNTYGALIPLEVQANKSLLFKHLLELYKSKGSEGSFKLLFQLVFGEDIEVILPKNNVLKPSASKWVIDNKLRINTDVYSLYTANGTSNIFILPQKVGAADIEVLVNGNSQQNNVDYYVNKEYRQLIFYSPPTNNSSVRVNYSDFDFKLFINRKVTGLTSGASAIIEDANRRVISDTFNLGLPIELLINKESLDGSFSNGEEVSIPILDSNDQLIEVRAPTFSVIKRFSIVDGGAGYSVGDKITVFSGNATANAIGTISGIFDGVLVSIQVNDGGAIFTDSSPVIPSGNGLFNVAPYVDGIDTSGTKSANTFIISTDIINSFNGTVHAANTVLSCTNFGFLNANIPTGENLQTRIIDALSYAVLQVGPITNVKILSTSVPLNLPITLDAFGALYGPETNFRNVKSLGSIGSFKINDGGLNYKIGDEIIFGPNPVMTFGIGAAAVVGNVNSSGTITRIDVANTRLTGVVSATSGTTTLIGSGTKFDSELKAYDTIDVNGESKIVATINDPITLSVFTSFDRDHVNQKVGVFNYYPKGGYGYIKDKLPTVSVSSSTGSGANIEIASLASDGESLSPSGQGVIGSITSVDIVDPGAGYEFIPVSVIESATGTGGKVKAEIEKSFVSGGGRWTTSDSLISSTERRIQGRNYYVDYSYVISSKTEFYKYKKVLKELLHPVGLIKYAEYKKSSVIEGADIVVKNKDIQTDKQYKTIGGYVNVANGSVLVTGAYSATKFNIANNLGIINLSSSTISVNGEIRKINTIISNVSLLTIGEVANVVITNPGRGYVNSDLVFSNGGGRIVGLTLSYGGSGYSNGSVVFRGAQEDIAAIANVEVYPSNGKIKTVSLSTGYGGLYSKKPIAEPFEDPHLVYYGNTITISSAGRGYTNGKFIFVGGAPTRNAAISFNVHPSNGAVNLSSINVGDSGLYEANATLISNTAPNVVIFKATTANSGNGHSNGTIVFNDLKVTSITANAGAVGVNSWITLANNIGIIGESNVVMANARVYVNTKGFIQNVTLYTEGVYFNAPTLANSYTNLKYVNDTATVGEGGSSAANGSNGFLISKSSYTNAVFTITTARYSNLPASIDAEVYSSNGSIRKLTITGNGLYANSVRVNTITANAGSIGVNSWINFAGTLGYSNNRTFDVGDPNSNVANARIFVNTTGHILNVTVYANGFYTGLPEISNVYTSLIYYENTTPIATYSYTNADFTISTTNLPTIAGPLVGVLNTWPIHVTGIGPNVSVNPLISYNGIAHQNGYIVFTGGDPVFEANASVEVYPSNGVIRKITVSNAGLYRSIPTAKPNSTPVSITEVLPLTPEYGGRGYSSGYLKIVNGGANTIANVQAIANAAGSIIRVQINSIGLYANGENINITPAVESITANDGALGVNSWITFSYGTPDSSVNVANARVYVNTEGFIQNVTVLANGIYTVLPTTIGGSSEANVYLDLKYVNDTATVGEGGSSAANGSNGFFISKSSYTNAVFTIVMGPVLYHYNGATQGKVTGDNKLAVGARFNLAYNSNTSNIANLVVSTTANGLHTGNVVFTANSNTVTNAVFTVHGVANSQTIAIIDVDFAETNSSAVGSVEVYPSNGAIRKVTITSNGSYYYSPTIRPKHVGGVNSVTVNTNAIGVNSWINFSGDTNGPANVTNARVFVNTYGYIQNVTVYSNGIYNVLSTPAISNVYTSLTYYENTTPISTHSYTNAVYTIVRVGGSFEETTLSTTTGAFTQSANLQTAIVSHP